MLVIATCCHAKGCFPRVVSHDFDMGDWKPLKTEQFKDDSSWDHTLYLWHVEAGKK